MLTRLHRQILSWLPLPFAAALLTLVFLLLMQFLINYLPDLVGRGLPFGALAELIAYSLAYMVTLAVPMAWLIALLAAFGRLGESRGYLVAKSAGVSLPRLAWPVAVVGLLLTVGMAYFNNQMLPEANYRMNGLWRDIRVSRPGFALTPGEFYTGVSGYAIRAAAIPPDSSGLLLGVEVFETRATGGGQALLTAERARLQTQYGGQRLTMLLEDGEVHRRQTSGSRDEYERLAFDRYRMAFDLSSLGGFERRERDGGGGRTDRSMRTTDMLAVVDSLDRLAGQRGDSIRAALGRWGRTPGDLPADGATWNSLALQIDGFDARRRATRPRSQLRASVPTARSSPGSTTRSGARRTASPSAAPGPSAPSPTRRRPRPAGSASRPTASGSRSTKRTRSRWRASCSCSWASRSDWRCRAPASGWWRRWPCSCSCSTGSRSSRARSWPTGGCSRRGSGCGRRT